MFPFELEGFLHPKHRRMRRVRDVSEDVARELVEVARLELKPLPENTQRFVERQLGEVPTWTVF